ncbi:Transmembrane protein 216 [Anabarilius grahami]|uniref:Transmembrane protein 216 n=1 Tax=Anabarilius grahami TaxID=495550 RepID=A0A3N0ZAQ3_ANAGA|nr:Transmembrane protein 216 [Anabarilius grahami]
MRVLIGRMMFVSALSMPFPWRSNMAAHGWKGNLCQRSLALFVSIGVLVPCAVLSVYYLLLQTFVLRLEVVLNAVLLCFYGFELVLGMMTISVFSR